MNETSLIDFDELDDILAQHDCEIPASEFQGLVCGLFAAGMANDGKSWQKPTLEHLTEGKELPGLVMDILGQYTINLGALLENDIFAMPLAIPELGVPIGERVTHLSRWCQGFLLGYGLQIGNQSLNNDDTQEALTDLSEIAQVDLEVDDSEESEQGLMTVIEHVRVTSQVVFLETRSHIAKAFQEARNPTTRLH